MATTALQVRNILPNLLINEDAIGLMESGTNLVLTDEAIECPTILKGITTLTEGVDYDFVRPDDVTLNVAANYENFTATVYIGTTDTILDTLILTAEEVIDDYFYRYSTPAVSNKTSWTKWLAASYYLFNYCAGSDADISQGEQFQKLAYDSMKRYKENTNFDTPTKENSHRASVYKV